MLTLNERRAAYAELIAEQQDLLDTAQRAGRELSAKQIREFDRLDANARSLADSIEDEQAELDEHRASIERREKMTTSKSGAIRPDVEERWHRYDGEELEYNPTAERRGASFFRDVMLARQDVAAAGRLQRHMAQTPIESRDVATSAVTGLVPPAYLTELVAPLARAGRPTADLCNTHPLPPDGMVANISRITTGAAAATQATENTAVQETDIDDTLLTVNVRTIAGMQDVSRQAIDRGVGVDEIVMTDLARAYNTELNRQIINTDGTSGTHLGIRSTASIISVAYTDASPTAAEAYPKLFDLVQQIQTGVFMGVSHWIMHPRRWWWFVSQVGTTFPFLQLAGTSQGAGGTVAGTGLYGTLGGMLGTIPVVTDATIPTNLGAGTNEDVILGVTAAELHLWEETRGPLFIRTEEVLANQLSIRYVAYGYTGFTAGRYPGAHGTIGGTGLVTPTFA